MCLRPWQVLRPHFKYRKQVMSWIDFKDHFRPVSQVRNVLVKKKLNCAVVFAGHTEGK
jgi:hypothetical protein